MDVGFLGDKINRSSDVALSTDSATPSAGFVPPLRPGWGRFGEHVVIRANHFPVEVTDKNIHHYDAKISPEVTFKKTKKRIIGELIHLYKEFHSGRNPVYDGQSSLYTAGPLPFASRTFTVKIADSPKSWGSARRVREFQVAITFAAKPDLSEFLDGKRRDVPQETIQALSVVLRNTMSIKYMVVNGSYFSGKWRTIGELGDGLEYWKGSYQSLRPTQMGLSLNIDVSTIAFYEPIIVTEFVLKSLNVKKLTGPLFRRNRVKISKSLIGLTVNPTHTVMASRCKVTGLSVNPAIQLMFDIDDETQVSVYQYFAEKYKIKLKFPFLPCLQIGKSAKPIYFPMELCSIYPGQRFMQKLNEKQVTAMLKATCQRPADREMSIQKIFKCNRFNAMNDIVTNVFGMNFKEDFTTINARVLSPPMLKYSGAESNVRPLAGQWNMLNRKMFDGGTVNYWTCINFSARMSTFMVRKFCDGLIGMCNSKGMVFNPVPLIPCHTSDALEIENSLAHIRKQAVVRLDKHLELLIIILPDTKGSYGLIKRVCETRLGIVSQCCQPIKALEMNEQYLENLSLKMNVKVGGRNTVLLDFFNRHDPLICAMPTIIFGADVTHPQPGEDSSPSIAAVVASMDWPVIATYRALVSSQPYRVEMIEDLYRLTVDHLLAFYRATGRKPHRIIFYRDGVSEGQFAQVLLNEMDAIRKACASFEEEYMPPVTFIVVQKRHHTRFFTSDQQDKSGNVLPGTVVDTKICHPTGFDFYLNSHAGIQGTSRPTHYHVLFDENNLTPDQLQSLTYKLCYTYARCTRSVSVVPPVYYAHLAAYRARYYVEGVNVSDSGSTSDSAWSTRESSAVVRALPAINDRVKDVMYVLLLKSVFFLDINFRVRSGY